MLITRSNSKGRFLETSKSNYLQASDIEYSIKLSARENPSGIVEIIAQNESNVDLRDVRIGYGSFATSVGIIHPNKKVVFRIVSLTTPKAVQDIVSSESAEESANKVVSRLIRRRFGLQSTNQSTDTNKYVHPVNVDTPPEARLLFNFIDFESPWLSASVPDGIKDVRLEHIGVVIGS